MYVPTPAQGVQIGMYMEGKKEKTLRRKFWAIIAIKTNLSSHYARKSGCYFLYFGFINSNNRDNFLDSINRAFIAGYHTSKGDRNFIPDQTSFKQCFIGSHFKKLSFLSRISTNNNNELDFNSTNFLYPVTHSIGAPVQWLCSTKDKTNPNIHIRKRCSLSPHVNKSLTPTSCYFFAIDRPLSVLPMAHKTPTLFIVR